MAVTDMTESLPWWARGAMPQSQGPVAPQGASQQAWLDYLSSMFGVGAAQAGENDPTAALNAALKARPPGPPPPDNRIPPTLPPAGPPGPQGPPGYLNSTSATPPGSPGSPFSPPDLTARTPVNPNAPAPAAQPVSAAAPAA